MADVAHGISRATMGVLLRNADVIMMGAAILACAHCMVISHGTVMKIARRTILASYTQVGS